MNEKPIIFNSEMVCAILDGRKTQTRRIMKPQPDLVGPEDWHWNGWRWQEHPGTTLKGPDEDCPYGQPGDRLWVRETWSDVNLQGAPGIAYRADDDIRDLMAEPSFHDEDGAFNYDDDRVKPYHFAAWSEDLLSGAEGRWRPSIHMPRWASRITLEVTSVRAERLNDISVEDAQSEGCAKPDLPPELRGVAGDFVADERTTFAILWNRINGRGAWAENPWVWVVEFKRVDSSALGKAA